MVQSTNPSVVCHPTPLQTFYVVPTFRLLYSAKLPSYSPPANVYLPSPSPHAPPQDQQAAAPTASYTPPPSPSPASSHHKSPESPASSDTPHTASHPCASQSGTSP